MSSVKGFSVALGKEVSEEHADEVKKALLMIKGVEEVTILSSDFTDSMAYSRARYDMRDKFIKFLKEDLKY